ncbi:methyl-accepting chemotaxis protein [Vibrio tritonius]|uniref:Methyl-accepting chemotaxis protein n=1 Tax=Vibrio tritonius TaxID=1435069 RepID=A0ABS7YT60_9VIBR|nr:methyl-accepting chemotaxis protein [Vibrio tritonius]MCA2018873.1 methyl-accepting chemotaxis protein [Vibrio tritonius]
MSKLGFKRTLILSSALITGLSVGTSNYFNYRSASEILTTTIYQNTTNYVHQIAGKLTSFITQKSRAIDNLAQDYQKNNYTSNHAQNMRIAASASDIFNITIGFDNGDAYCSYPLPGWTDFKNPPTYNASQRPWFKDAMSASGLIYTDPYADATTQELMVSIGKRAGTSSVVLADIPLTVLKDVVNSVEMKGAVTLIMQDDSSILASTSTAVEVGQKLMDFGSLSHLVDKIKRGDRSIDYKLGDVDKVMFSEKIQYGDKNWYLLVGLDKSVVFASLDSMAKQTIILTIICVVIAVLLTMLLLNILYRPILALKETIHTLSSGEGDLTRRLDVTSNDDLGIIAEDVNTFISHLQKMMLQIEDFSGQLVNNISSLERTSTQNSTILNQHVRETEQISTAIEEMSATANMMAQNAQESVEYTKEVSQMGSSSLRTLNNAKSYVDRLVSDVENTASSMSNMSDETKGINQILSVIGDIAAQTNLLALNAAIEAARAGEQGRGFAVVADEVRALASRTQESTEEIERALTKLLDGSQEVLSLMEGTKSTCHETFNGTTEVETSLNSLTSQVGNITDLSIKIATSAEEQDRVTAEISKNMSEITDIVKQLNQNDVDSSAQVNDISGINERLATIVGKFKLR